MKSKINFIIFYGLAFMLFIIFISPAYSADTPYLYFDDNVDGAYSRAEQMDLKLHDKASLEIWLTSWNSSKFAGESLFGVKMYLMYDHKKIQVNKAKSFANDTSNGGIFTPDFTIMNDLGVGVIQLEVCNFNCINITDNLLLYTVALESINPGRSEVEITVDFPSGAIMPGRLDCKPHLEDCGGSTLIINSINENDENDENDEQENGSTTTVSSTTIEDSSATTSATTTANASNITTTVMSSTNANIDRTTIPGRDIPGTEDSKEKTISTFKRSGVVYTTTIKEGKNAEEPLNKGEPASNPSKSLKKSLYETTTITPPSAYILLVSPESSILNSGGLMQFNAKTVFDGDKVEGNYMWDISPKSPIGSSIDENGLFSVGINKTDVSIMETVVVTDKLNGNMTESASVIIKSIEQEPSGCELSINIASATVLPGDTIKFSANNIGDKCEKGGFKWTINSKIGSSISSNGLYTAKSNHTDNSALDIIIVEDKSNQLRTNAIVTVLPEEKATLPVNDSKIPPQQKKPSERGGYSKVLTAFAIIVLLIVVVLYLRRRGQNVHTKDNRT